MRFVVALLLASGLAFGVIAFRQPNSAEAGWNCRPLEGTLEVCVGAADPQRGITGGLVVFDSEVGYIYEVSGSAASIGSGDGGLHCVDFPVQCVGSDYRAPPNW